jgi:hypothetical protein
MENRASYIVNFVPTLFDDSNRAALSQDIKDLQDQCLETRADSIIAAQMGMMNRPSRIGVLQQLERHQQQDWLLAGYPALRHADYHTGALLSG